MSQNETQACFRSTQSAKGANTEHDPTVRHCTCRACESWRRRIRRLYSRWMDTAKSIGAGVYQNFAEDLESELLND